MFSSRKVIVGLMYVVIAALLGYYGRAKAVTPPTQPPTTPPASNTCSATAPCATAGQYCYNGTCQAPSGTCTPACVAPQQCFNSVCATPT